MWEKNKKAKYYTNTAGTFKLCHIYASIEFWAGNTSGKHQSLTTVIEMIDGKWNENNQMNHNLVKHSTIFGILYDW